MNEPLSEPVAPASGFEREHQRLDRQLRAHLLAVVGADFSAAHDKLTRWQRALLRHIDIENTRLLPHVPAGARWDEILESAYGGAGFGIAGEADAGECQPLSRAENWLAGRQGT